MNLKFGMVLFLSFVTFFYQMGGAYALEKQGIILVTDTSGIEWCMFTSGGSSTTFFQCANRGISSADPEFTERYSVSTPTGAALFGDKKTCFGKGKEIACPTTTVSGTTTSGATTPTRRVNRKNLANSGSSQTGANVQTGALSTMSSGTVFGRQSESASNRGNVSVPDFSIVGKILAIFSLIGTIIGTILSLLMGWGLYLINKKSGEKYPWLAFIPMIQLYSFVKAGGKNGIWVLWLILGYVCLVIPGVILTIMVMSSTSKRTGNGTGTTILMFLFPCIMYPIIGNYMPDKTVTITVSEPVTI